MDKNKNDQVRVLAKRIKTAWKEIYGGRTQWRSVGELEASAAIPPPPPSLVADAELGIEEEPDADKFD